MKINKALQRLLSGILATVLILSLWPVGTLTASASTVASGICGDSLAWALDSDGVLTISGTGAMPDFATTVEKPWNSNRSKIKKVIIADGVTTIGRYAFCYCENLTDIIVPDSIEHVSSDAFGGCTSLVQTEGGVSYAGNIVLDCDTSVTEVTLRENTVAIASSAFYHCTSLTSITIPKSVVCISNQAFDNCTALATVTLEEGSCLKSIGSWVFYDCKLTSFTIPVQLTSIGQNAFVGLTDLYITDIEAYLNINGTLPGAGKRHILDANGNELTKLTIPQGITEIRSSAFSNATSITSVQIPKGVTSIGDSAFSGLSALESVHIPQGVTTIGRNAFYNGNLTSVFLPGSVTNIGSYAFHNSTQNIEITYCGTREQWKAVTRGTYWAIKRDLYVEDAQVDYYHRYNSAGKCTVCNSGAQGSCGMNLTWQLDPSAGTLTISGTGAMNDYTMQSYVPWYSYRSGIKKVVIQSGVTSIGDYAFSYYDGLTSVNLPEGMERIGAYAFQGCTELKNITIPETLTYIGSAAFNGCSFEKVNITNLAAWCNIDFGNFTANPISEKSNLYLNGELVTEAVIPEGATKIGDYVFFKYYGLKSITIPDSVMSIGEEALYYCKNLESIQIGKGVTTIGEGAFRYCAAESIVLPNSVTSIAENAFSDSVELTTIWLGRGIKNIGRYAFYGCENLKDVYYLGSEADRGNINVATLNDPLTNAAWHYNSCFGTMTHSYKWIIDQENNCGVDGVKHQQCMVCDAVQNEGTVIEATGNHSYDHNCDVDCNVCEAVRSIEHAYEWVIDQQNNCGEDGAKHEQCVVCGVTRNEGTVIEATGDHAFVWIIDQDATCGGAGVRHEKCTVCNTVRNENTVIEATGDHTYEWIIDKENNCGVDGIKHEKCTVCGTIVNENTAIPATGDHAYEWIIDKENNCGVDGIKHEQCTVCDTIRNENTVITATGDHAYEWVVDKENNCGIDGVKHETCTVCGAVRNEGTVIEATGKHSYDNNCDAICNVCEYQRIPSAHRYYNSCDTTCNECGAIRTIEHTYSNNCDAYCNVCYEYRTPFDHVYSGEFDTTCDECGSIRAVAGQFAIVYHLDGGENALKNPDVYTFEDKIVLKDAKKDGYDFAGWYLDADKTEAIVQIFHRAGELHLHAKYTPKNYEATFDIQGVTCSDYVTVTLNDTLGTEKTFTVRNGSVFSPYNSWNLPARTGYVFAGWEYNGKLIADTIQTKENVELTAVWKPTNTTENAGFYTILRSGSISNSGMFFYSGGTNVASSYSCTRNQTTSTLYVYISGERQTVNYLGYSFYNKYTQYFPNDPSSNKTYYSTGGFYISNVTTGQSLVDANGADDNYSSSNGYKRKDYNGTLVVEPGTLLAITVSGATNDPSKEYDRTPLGGLSITAGDLRDGVKITYSGERVISQTYDAISVTPAVQKAGYDLIGWYDENDLPLTETWKYTENKSFYPKWQPKRYQISYELNGGVNSDSNPSSYTVEDSFALASPQKTGYTFNGWYTDPEFTNRLSGVSNRTGDVKLYAKYTVNTYTLTLDSNGGVLAPKVTFVSDGEIVKSVYLTQDDVLTAYRPDARTGYIFAGWYEEEGLTSLFKFSGTISEDTVLYAKWIPCNKTTLEVESTDAFSVSVQGKTEQLYAFIPLVDGEISVTSKSDSLDLCGTLYDSTMTVLVSSDDISDDNLNFGYSYSVEAGKTYYIAVSGNTVSTVGDTEIGIAWVGDCTVTGKSENSQVFSIVYGDPFTLPEAVRKEHQFFGWFNESGAQITGGTWNFTANQRAYAKWVPVHAAAFENADGGQQKYLTLAEALEQLSAGSTLKLLKDNTEELVISKDIVLDLNGFDLTGNITACDGTKLLVKDSQTDDYTIEDEAGYGKLMGTVTGVQAADGYMLITEEDGVSFHRIDLDIHTMTLRPSEVGVYYQSDFAGDEIVARNVARYGVALSVQGEPTADAPGILSWFEGFQAGSNAANGTLLHGIMKLTNSIADNAANAQLPVYGRAYILTKDGQYIFGKSVSRSLRQQVEAIDSRWSTLTADQKTGLLEMYESYQSVMESWNIPNIKSK